MTGSITQPLGTVQSQCETTAKGDAYAGIAGVLAGALAIVLEQDEAANTEIGARPGARNDLTKEVPDDGAGTGVA